ncbi:MAG: hypothetical protein ACK5LJ_00385 [Paracoccus sp. (in: a-proteobacteria)]
MTPATFSAISPLDQKAAEAAMAVLDQMYAYYEYEAPVLSDEIAEAA